MPGSSPGPGPPCYTRSGRCDDAYPHLHSALDLYRDLGDDIGQANTHLKLGEALAYEDKLVDSLYHATEALTLYRALAAVAARPMTLTAPLHGRAESWPNKLTCGSGAGRGLPVRWRTWPGSVPPWNRDPRRVPSRRHG